MPLPPLPKRVEQVTLPLALLWSEMALKASTTGEFWPELLFIVPFSLALGLLGELVCSLARSARANKVAKLCLMTAGGVVFCVEYFVYREFKLFYDLNTVTAGAADVATGFSDRIGSLVLSPGGLLRVALFLAPACLYAIVGRGQDRHRSRERLTVLGLAVTAQVLGLALVFSVGAFGHAYGDRYSFATSVPSFGLFTSLRKEVQSQLLGPSPALSFTSRASILSPTVDTTERAAHEALLEKHVLSTRRIHAKGGVSGADRATAYGQSVSDIDFVKLADTTEGTWANLDRYVASLTPSSKNFMTGRLKGYNLIFVSAEAFSAEAIREDTTPTLWRMAHKGIRFTDYYQFDSAGTTGGECGNLFGLLPTEGGSSVKGTATHNNYLTMGNALNRKGYNGWAFHNNTYTYYGRDKTHNNLGYSNGFMGYGNGMEKWVTWQWPQSDLEMVQGTFDELYGRTEQEPFNVYYMSVSGHSGYARGENMMSEKHWDEVADLPYSDPVKGYLACNIELDRAMEWLIGQLEKKGMADHTAIVIAADHFPYGLDDDGPLGSLPYTSELYGFDVQTYFQRDHNRLILWSGSLERGRPIVVDSPVGAIDVLPTLLNLFGCPWDSRLLPGRDVFSDKDPLVFDLSFDWKTDKGTYYAATGKFVANEGVTVPDGYVERTSADVADRITFCRGVLTSDYYRHVFGDPQDVIAVHDAARKAARN